ncbi:MAG: beta-N-acetylhexosaminidase [Acholeplasmataceae bacterium]
MKTDLDLKRKIGQLLMFGFDATTINEHAIHMIRDLKIGNVILFTRNIESPKQLHGLTSDLQELALKHIGIPLFIAIDQEGGMVTRIRKGGTFFPGAMTISATKDPEHATWVGETMGKELALLGINVDFAPVLDINIDPRNPVIGVRSYADDEEKVALFGSAFIKGLQKHVIATAKHFPGHGDTHLDSHLALPYIDVDRRRLDRVELYPFRVAIREGVQAIMSSHIVFKALDNRFPATLSSSILTDLLRDELGFAGLIFTDCLQMKAIQNTYTTPRAAVMAVRAGANVMCICHSEHLQEGAQNEIMRAVRDQELSTSLIDERVARVLGYKASLEPFAYSESDVRNGVGTKAARNKSEAIVKRAVTRVKGKPFRLKNRALLIGIIPEATSIADETGGTIDFYDRLKQALPSLDVLAFAPGIGQQDIDIASSRAEDYDQVVLCTYNANTDRGQQELIERVVSLEVEHHVIAMRNPYDLVFVPEIANYVCFYENTPNALEALIDYLKGTLVPEGRLPIIHE